MCVHLCIFSGVFVHVCMDCMCVYINIGCAINILLLPTSIYAACLSIRVVLCMPVCVILGGAFVSVCLCVSVNTGVPGHT